MSALLVDDLYVQPAPQKSAGWRHVESRSTARQHLSAVPDLADRGVVQRPSPTAAAAPLRLTDRGLAVVIGFFLALLATAAVVLVASFLNVSNEPLSSPEQFPAVVAIAG